MAVVSWAAIDSQRWPLNEESSWSVVNFVALKGKLVASFSRKLLLTPPFLQSQQKRRHRADAPPHM